MATKGIVKGIVSNLVTVEVDGPVSQNEICYISVGGVKLMAEVIKVIGKNAFVQVFESTRGMRVGDEAEFEGHMLEVTLGPGMLSRNYDGLQNDLDKMEGVFLRRGEYTFPLDNDKLWDFKPLAKVGDKVTAGGWLGEVDENFQPHKIMVPFTFKGEYTVKSLKEAGQYTIGEVIAVLTDETGKDVEVTMIQRWPVKRAITCYKEKPRPYKLLETGVRTIDTVNPIVEGGTGFIPGPFGTGKTVLQHAISKQAEADIVIIAACGERANEVVEIFTEFPELIDPHTGRKLMERTIIIANTSNMPVAAREASVYTAMTIAEYYRSMGLKVLLMADSTSRWAQALREMSNRLEELPGPDAFPMDLSAIVANFYARAGYVHYHVIFWKSELIDFVILQQDAFDAIDAVTPLARQEFMLNKVVKICHAEFKFNTFLEVMEYFKKMINIFKQMNYSEYESEQFKKFNDQLDALIAEREDK